MVSRLFLGIALTASLLTQVASFPAAKLHAKQELTVQPVPGWSAAETIEEIGRQLRLNRRSDTDVIFEKSTVLDRNFDNLILFKYNETTTSNNTYGFTIAHNKVISFICKTCYIKGSAHATLSHAGDPHQDYDTFFGFNDEDDDDDDDGADGGDDDEDVDDNKEGDKSTQKRGLRSRIKKHIESKFDEIKDWVDLVGDEVKEELKDQLTPWDDTHDFSLPPPPIDFDMSLRDLAFPKTQLDIVLKDLEMYAKLDITLSEGVFYTLNLFKTRSMGGQFGHVFAGVVFSVDLMFVARSNIRIGTGLHVKLDDDVKMKLAMFSEDAMETSWNGGRVEFLPIEIELASITVSASLRISVRSGFSFAYNNMAKGITVMNATASTLRFSAGIEATAYATIAELMSTITALNLIGSVKNETCDVVVNNTLRFAVGAMAGASLYILGNMYGPVPRTEIPLYSTALGTSCARSRDPLTAMSDQGTATTAAMATTTVNPNMITTTTVVPRTYIATECANSELANCPASLQMIRTHEEMETFTTTVPKTTRKSWVWPLPTKPGTVVNVIPFGTKVHTFGRRTPLSSSPTAAATTTPIVVPTTIAG